MADVGQVFVTRHTEGSEEGVRKKRCRPAEHGSQGFCAGVSEGAACGNVLVGLTIHSREV